MAEVGRPTKYKAEFAEIFRAYLTDYAPDAIPMIMSIAIKLDVSRDTIQAWGKNEEDEEHLREFSVVYRSFNNHVERAILNLGFANKSPQFCQFYLKSKLNYQEVKHIEANVTHAADEATLARFEEDY